MIDIIIISKIFYILFLQNLNTKIIFGVVLPITSPRILTDAFIFPLSPDKSFSFVTNEATFWAHLGPSKTFDFSAL